VVRVVTVLLAFRKAGRVGSRNGIQESVCLGKNDKTSVPLVIGDKGLDLAFRVDNNY
jgi:hypothetical protein